MSNLLAFLKHPITSIKKRKLFKRKSLYSDEEYLLKMFPLSNGYPLDLKNPKTYNEKIQWLKLYNRDPKLTMLVDKYAVRDFVKKTIGEEYLVPLIGVWEKPEDIPFEKLPNKYVLKCTHNSGKGMFIKDNNKPVNKQEVINNLNIGLQSDMYLHTREWPYKDVPRRIVCEEFLEDGSNIELQDFKFFCFDGKFRILLVCSDRHTKLANDWYDEDLKHLPVINGPKNRKEPFVLPKNIDEMIAVAEKLAVGLTHVRVDLYNLNGKIYFGEMTFFESSGLSPFKPKEYDLIFGSYINLPNKKV